MGTAIEWTDETWNPVTGCSKVSPGCAHCYAEALAPRLARMGQQGYTSLPWTPENAEANVFLHSDRLTMPLRWRRPRRVFVNSMSDLFHELVPDAFIAQVFGTMSRSPRHTFQVLTKRPERMREWVSRVAHSPEGWMTHDGTDPRTCGGTGEIIDDAQGWPLPNVWLGTSVENQHWADERIPQLLQTPAAVRFLSCEPLLGPVDLRSLLVPGHDATLDALTGQMQGWISHVGAAPGSIGWIIAGGESGPEHRPVDPTWIRSLRDQCTNAGVPFLFKQWGGRTSKTGGRVLDGRTWDQYPSVAA